MRADHVGCRREDSHISNFCGCAHILARAIPLALRVEPKTKWGEQKGETKTNKSEKEEQEQEQEREQ
jgi:hypothetical protein